MWFREMTVLGCAAKIAAGCRCAQEVCAFQPDPLA
jgi:hypothetical protein